MTPGIHLVHKPVGPTSFTVVQEYLHAARSDPSRAPGRRPPRICHGGTLDPFAAGLLLILIEPATRLFDYLHQVPKVYEATVRWGVETDNGDPLGQPVFTGDPSSLTPRQLDDELAAFLGWQEQVPPPTSAKRIDGERAYVKVQRGENVVLPASRVYLHEARWLTHALPRESRLRLVVRGGYYVRALARDLGRRLGCGAHLAALHRSAIGPWQDPGPAPGTGTGTGPGTARRVELHARDILPWAAVRELSDQDVGDLRQDQTIAATPLLAPDWPLPPGFPDPQAPIRGFHQGRFCFLLTPHEGRLRKLAALRGGL